MHTDIRNQGWILKLPKVLQPYALLARLDRPIGIWLLLLPGWWAIVLAAGGPLRMNGADWHAFALFAAGAVVMRAAGCVINDLWDRKLDQNVARTKMRPLAAGTISRAQAFVFLVVLLILGLLILLQMNAVTILLGFLTLPLIVSYPLMKRVTWWPQAFLGLTFNFGALMGWSAVTGALSLPALLLYAGGILWTLGYDTVYAHQDKEDDALSGIKSTALKFGARSKTYVGGFHAGAWILIAMAGMIATQNLWVVLFLLPAAVYNYLSWRDWNPEDAHSALETFKASRNTGFLVLAGFAAGALF